MRSWLQRALAPQLSGILRSFVKREQRQGYLVDPSRVRLYFMGARPPFTVRGETFCDDPQLGGLDISGIVAFYRADGFRTEDEARSFIDRQVRLSQPQWPDTRFYTTSRRSHPKLVVFDGRDWKDSERSIGTLWSHDPDSAGYRERGIWDQGSAGPD